ncbi:MAG TPA: hypothetical protein VF658_10960 [Pyrinomonadaceae bacterium]|jgi:hypothetical protein
MTKQSRIKQSLICGILITVVLTVIAFINESRSWTCTFAWQGCAVLRMSHPPDLPDGRVREGTPADPIIFLFGVSLGIPIYGGLTYIALSLAAKFRK